VNSAVGGAFFSGKNAEGGGHLRIGGSRGWCKTNSQCQVLNATEAGSYFEESGSGSGSGGDKGTCYSQYYVVAPAPGVFVKRTSIETRKRNFLN